MRELLLNFRTRLNKQDFVEAARNVLQRFEQQARITTRLNIQGGECWLSPQQQLQVIFILQEALSNVRKHAQAQNVRVDIHHQANAAGDFVMSIEDDGIGFEANTLENKRTRHVGTAIMHCFAVVYAAYYSAKRILKSSARQPMAWRASSWWRCCIQTWY